MRIPDSWEQARAAEQLLREALDRAWTDYQNAQRETKKEARKQYLAALARFARAVLH